MPRRRRWRRRRRCRGGADDRLDRAEARVGAADDATLVEDLHRLAERSGGTISVEVIDTPGDGASWSGDVPEPPTLDARTFTRDIDRQWQRTSFSSLVRGAEDARGDGGGVADPARDVDAEAEAEGTARSVDAPPGRMVAMCRWHGFLEVPGPGRSSTTCWSTWT
jgi:hypothetical protein